MKELISNFMELTDPRVRGWPLMGSPLPMFFIVAVYITFVTYLGPTMMRNRPAINLRKVMIAYNIFLIMINVYFVQQSMSRIWLVGRYHIYMEPVDYSTDPFAVEVAAFSWLFFISKILDMFDSVFIVLRKKSDQLSFLHIYHHAIAVFLIWPVVALAPGGSPILAGTVNSFVHSVMYSYYLVTIVNPEYKQYIWLKKCITQLQLAQFLFLGIVGCLHLYYTENTLLRNLCYLGLTQAVLFFFLFKRFYQERYQTKKLDTHKQS